MLTKNITAKCTQNNNKVFIVTSSYYFQWQVTISSTVLKMCFKVNLHANVWIWKQWFLFGQTKCKYIYIRYSHSLEHLWTLFRNNGYIILSKFNLTWLSSTVNLRNHKILLETLCYPYYKQEYFKNKRNCVRKSIVQSLRY